MKTKRTMSDAVRDLNDAWNELIHQIGLALGLDKLVTWIASKLKD